MARRITIIQGHPDPAGHHFGHALADAYSEGTAAAGHEVRRIDVAKIDFPLLRTFDEFYHGTSPDVVRPSQELIRWADHLVIFYPLWLGDMPALFKGFLEQTFRPDFAFAVKPGGKMEKRFGGKSARIVVTMGMPELVYRWYYRAHSVKSLERNILHFTGIRPVTTTLIGMVQGNEAKRKRWLEKLRTLGRRGN